MLSRNAFAAVAACAFSLVGPSFDSAHAESNYPARLITLIVPFAAGGPTDVVGRIVAESMSRTLGQQIVIENVVGAGGTTAGTRAMRALPDGYTLILGHMGTHGAAGALYPKLAYNPSTDFAPVGMVAGMPVLLVGKKDSPARDLGEFIAYAKEHPAGVTMAHAGMGSVSHVTCQLFNSILGLSPKLAAYQGSGPAMTALIAGKVDYMCDQVVTVVPQAKVDSIRIYAVATPARTPALPDIPTTKEAGLQQFEVSAWNAIFAPKHTPQPIIAKLNAALVIALDDEAVRKRLLELGSDIPDRSARSPEALAAVVKNDIAKWAAILRPVPKPE
jgi:tripartite-type tricarboxylate transporter receptor subunit TctC